MQKTLIFLIFVLVACSFKKEIIDKESDHKKSKIIPPGTVWLIDNLYIDDCEITNNDYLEFISFYEFRFGKNSEKLKQIIPDIDTNFYNSIVLKDTINNPRIEDNSIVVTKYISNSWKNNASGLYLYHPAYRDYPVTNISYEQAIEYCNFRTWAVNLTFYLDENRLKLTASNVKTDFPIKVKYRLPTTEEWEYAASAGLDIEKYPLGYESYLDKDNNAKFYTKEWKN